ncbi:MAG: hypothetical protein WC777_02465 [Candidatus Gracilibacteria bacterium]|jgi:hypothetical protein
MQIYAKIQTINLILLNMRNQVPKARDTVEVIGGETPMGDIVDEDPRSGKLQVIVGNVRKWFDPDQFTDPRSVASRSEAGIDFSSLPPRITQQIKSSRSQWVLIWDQGKENLER